MPTYLGFYLGHDSNIAVSVDGKIKYRKAERHFQKKHHKANLSFIFDTLKEWGISKIDFCAYTDGNRQNLGICNKNELYCSGFLSEFPNFCLDHHYAHILSAWPVVDTDTVDYGVSLDGRGDWNRSLAVIKNPATSPTLINYHDGLHMGHEFFVLGKMIGLKGLEYDLAGKIMGMQSYSEDEITSFGIPKLVNTKYKEILKYSCDGDYKSYQDWHEYWWKYVRDVFDFPSDSVISYTGGCAQNSVYNYRLKKFFPNLFIAPHCYDGGLSLGCLEFLRIKFNQPKFDISGFPFWQDDKVNIEPKAKTIKIAAELLSNGKIIGWMQGRGELGPRALGNRSILMEATKSQNKDILNSKVKKREPWRPYAGSILQEDSTNFFDMQESKYMLYACMVKNNLIPAITHIDKTCRMQTITSGIFYDLINEYKKISGVPVILNTSLNIMGNPIVSANIEPLNLLKECNLDALVVGDDIFYNSI